MVITRNISRDGSYCPAAINALGLIPQDALFHLPQQLRHPESIYRLSIEKVGARFCAVAESYLEQTRKYGGRASPDSFEIDEVLTHQHNLLHALQEHVDELWLILKTLVDPTGTASTAIHNDKYVLASKLPGAKSFGEAIAPYRTSLRIVNRLKHQQGYLRGVSVSTSNGPHLGYFLEEPDETGALGPSHVIHPDQRAFSFARDLIWHLFNVYMCSEKLRLAVQRALDARGITLRQSTCPGLQIWEKVIKLALSIPDAFFPSDFKRGMPYIFCDDQSQNLTIGFPRRVYQKLPSIIKVSSTIKIDGHSPRIKTPLI